MLVTFLSAMQNAQLSQLMKRKVNFGSWFEGTMPRPAQLMGWTRLGPLEDEERADVHPGKLGSERLGSDGETSASGVEQGGGVTACS